MKPSLSYLRSKRLPSRARRDFLKYRVVMWLFAAMAGFSFGLFNYWAQIDLGWLWRYGIAITAWTFGRWANHWRKASNDAAYDAWSDGLVVSFLSSDEAHKPVPLRRNW